MKCIVPKSLFVRTTPLDALSATAVSPHLAEQLILQQREVEPRSSAEPLQSPDQPHVHIDLAWPPCARHQRPRPPVYPRQARPPHAVLHHLRGQGHAPGHGGAPDSQALVVVAPVGVGSLRVVNISRAIVVTPPETEQNQNTTCKM